MATQPTQLPVPSEKPQDLKFNAGKIDAFVTSMGWTYTDRFGNKHYTIEGMRWLAQQAIAQYGYITIDSFQAGASITLPNQALRYTSNGEYYRWDGALPKEVPAGSTPSSTGGVGIGAWVSVGDAALRTEIKGPGGETPAWIPGFKAAVLDEAGLVPDGTVDGVVFSQLLAGLKILFSPASVTVNLANYSTLKLAIAALPATGGVIFVPVGNHESGSWSYNIDYMNKPNVKIIGEKMPFYNGDMSALVGGSVIKGRFNAFADNFEIESVGFDNGKQYIDAKYPGVDTHVASPSLGTWDALAFASPQDGSTPRRNVHLRNVVGLLYDSLTVGHAILCESINGGSAENMSAIYGVHGFVIKALNFNVRGVTSFAQSGNGMIIKSDSYAPCGNIKASQLTYRQLPDNISPWYTPPSVDCALNINTGTAPLQGPIQIESTTAKGSIKHVIMSGAFDMADIQIGNIVTDGLNSSSVITTDWPLLIDGAVNVFRVNVSNMVVNNAKQAVLNKQKSSTTDQQLHINSLNATNILNSVIYGMRYGSIIIDNLDARSVGHLYHWEAEGKIYVDKERVVGLGGSKFDLAALSPILANGWDNFGGSNDVYDFSLRNYRASLKGLVKPGTTAEIVTIPSVLRPALSKRIPVMINTTTTSVTFVSIFTTVQIQNNSIPSGLTYASLEGVEWDY